MARPPEPTIPPEFGIPPVPGAPPVPDLPPVPGVPPEAGALPPVAFVVVVAVVPPDDGIPPIEAAPPLPTVPPVTGRPPVSAGTLVVPPFAVTSPVADGTVPVVDEEHAPSGVALTITNASNLALEVRGLRPLCLMVIEFSHLGSGTPARASSRRWTLRATTLPPLRCLPSCTAAKLPRKRVVQSWLSRATAAWARTRPARRRRAGPPGSRRGRTVRFRARRFD